MRILFVLISIAATACTTKPVEGVCCVTEADCATLGVDEPRPCDVGQACKAFHCVAAECDSSAECASPDAPVCADNLCVASCRGDADCAGAAGGPYCAEDGVCVGCFANADCPASAPFCDAEDRRCRGCEADAECASGVCIEADAVCAEPTEIVHVQMFGNDTGDCTGTMACASFTYALGKVSSTRKVLRVSGGNFAQAGTIAIDRPVVIDASNTNFTKPPGVPLFSIGASLGSVTLEGVALLGSSDPTEPTITVATGSTLRIVRSSLSTSLVEVVNGGLDLREARIASSLQTMNAVKCTNGTVSARRVDFDHTTIQATNCQLNISRCHFNEITSGSIGVGGGIAIIENNLFIQAYELADMMGLANMAPGSTVRFNTFVNTSGVASDGLALTCDSTVAVSSNIFAYASAHPIGSPGGTRCTATYSLFDSVAVAEQTTGEGNMVADASTFFVNRAAQDFHLAGTSPAKGAASPGLAVTEDLDGNARPTPLGSRPDTGCYEAP